MSKWRYVSICLAEALKTSTTPLVPSLTSGSQTPSQHKPPPQDTSITQSPRINLQPQTQKPQTETQYSSCAPSQHPTIAKRSHPQAQEPHPASPSSQIQ